MFKMYLIIKTKKEKNFTISYEIIKMTIAEGIKAMLKG